MFAKLLHKNAKLTKIERRELDPYEIVLAKSEREHDWYLALHITRIGPSEPLNRPFREEDIFRLLSLESYGDCQMTKGLCYSWLITDEIDGVKVPSKKADRGYLVLSEFERNFQDAVRLLSQAAEVAHRCGLNFWESQPGPVDFGF